MIEVEIRSSVLKQFIQDSPKDFFDNSVEVNGWHSFKKFLQGGANLIINEEIDVNSSEAMLLNILTTGRRGTTIKYKLVDYEHKANIQSMCFVDSVEDIRFNERQKEGLFVSCKDNYLTDWIKVSNTGEKLIFNISPLDNELGNWKKIGDYLHTVTDVVIIDKYILHNTELFESNLFKILDLFIGKKVNLSIITSNDKDTDRKKIYELISKRFGNLKSISIFSNPERKTWHDRSVITNFTRFSSGDSFVFFNSKNEVITGGTELSVRTLIEREEDLLADKLLKGIAKSIAKITEIPLQRDQYLFGDFRKNRLIARYL